MNASEVSRTCLMGSMARLRSFGYVCALLLADTTGTSLAGKAQASPTCPSENLSNQQVVDLQTRLLAALSNEERASWDNLVAPDFSAFEGGKQYGREGFFNLVAALNKSGYKLVWSVSQPRVKSSCAITVMSYVNVGSIAVKDADPKPMRWLESVAFRKDAGNWQAVLITSMRVEGEAP